MNVMSHISRQRKVSCRRCATILPTAIMACLQIRCGDLYASPAVEEFTKCAVSDKGCVPQRRDGVKEYPVPPDRDLVKNFDLSQFQVCEMAASWKLAIFTCRAWMCLCLFVILEIANSCCMLYAFKVGVAASTVPRQNNRISPQSGCIQKSSFDLHVAMLMPSPSLVRLPLMELLITVCFGNSSTALV